MTKLQKVSIVIPVYNGSNFLRDAIDSALAQTYNNTEIVVINDGSTDDGATRRIAQTYGDKIRYYEKPNGGVATALNYGIKKMSGQYFSWLSHDDMYEKTKIEKQVDLLRLLKKEDAIIACNTKTLFANGLMKNNFIDKKTFKYIDVFLATSANVGLHGCALLIPKKVLLESSGFNPNLPFTQDYDMWFRLRNRCEFILLEDNLVVSRRHSGQDSVTKQKLCLEAGDQLHCEFLSQISRERFQEYFSDDRYNIRHIWKNYALYKARGFNKTAAMILKILLEYSYDNDKKEFYRIFITEAGLSQMTKRLARLRFNKFFSSKLKLIDEEYKELLSNGRLYGQIRQDLIRQRLYSDNSKKMTPLNLLVASVKEDGINLTMRRIAKIVIKEFKTSKRN